MYKCVILFEFSYLILAKIEKEARGKKIIMKNVVLVDSQSFPCSLHSSGYLDNTAGKISLFFLLEEGNSRLKRRQADFIHKRVQGASFPKKEKRGGKRDVLIRYSKVAPDPALL